MRLAPVCIALITAVLAACREHTRPLARSTPSGQEREELPPGAVLRLGTVRLRHPDVRRVALSHRGDLVAAASSVLDYETIPVFQTADGRLLWRLAGHERACYCVAFSPVSDMLASGGYDGTVRLWDARKGTAARELGKHAAPVRAVCFSHDAARVASFDETGEFRWWDAGTGALVERCDGPAADDVAVSADGSLMASAGGNRLALFRRKDDAWERVPWEAGGSAYSVALSRDGRRVAVGGHEVVEVFDTRTGATIFEAPVPGEQNRVLAVAFSPDARTLVSAHDDGVARVWDVERKRIVQELRGHRFGAEDVEFSADGRLVATAACSGVVRLWDPSTWSERAPGTGHTGEIACVRWSPDGMTVATSASDGTVRLWNGRTGACVGTLRDADASSDSIHYAPDGKSIFAVGEDGVVRVWDTRAMTLVRRLACKPRDITAIALVSAREIVAGDGDGGVYTCDLRTGEFTRRAQFDHGVTAIAVTPSSGLVAIASWFCFPKFTGTTWLHLADLKTWEKRTVASAPSARVCALTFTPDGRTLLCGSYGAETYRIDSDDPLKATGPYRIGHDSGLGGAALSPAGTHVVVCGSNRGEGTWFMVDLSTGRSVASGRGGYIPRSCAVSPDARFMVTGGVDTGAIVWSLPNDK